VRLGRAAPLALCLLCLAPASAAALDPPTLLVRDLDLSGEPAGDWLPLDGAAMHSIYGSQLGLRLQVTDRPANDQRLLAEVTSVPDGQPNQTDVYSLCLRFSGTPGTIAPVEGYVHYEGDGVYGIRGTATTGTDMGTGCKDGPATTATYSVSTSSSIVTSGTPLLYPLDPATPFAGASTTVPLGASRAEVTCARDAVVGADGSLTGSAVDRSEGLPPASFSDAQLYSEPGYWRCVVRGSYGPDQVSPWSAPTPRTLVQAAYRGLSKPFTMPDRTGPTYRFTSVIYPFAAGATVTLRSEVIKGCHPKTGAILVRRKGRRVVSATAGKEGALTFRLRLAPPTRREGRRAYLVTTTLTGHELVRTGTVRDLVIALDRKGRRTRGLLLGGYC
jgi:hypothetical protein